MYLTYANECFAGILGISPATSVIGNCSRETWHPHYQVLGFVNLCFLVTHTYPGLGIAASLPVQYRCHDTVSLSP